MKQPLAVSSDLAALIRRAETLPCARSSVRTLATEGMPTLLSAAHAAADAAAWNAATLLALAAAVCGGALDEALLLRVVPRSSDSVLLPAFLRSYAGDRFELLAALFRQRTLPPGHEFFAIRLAVELAPPGDPDPDLRRAARRAARWWLLEERDRQVAEILAGAGDPGAASLVGRAPLSFEHPTRQGWRADARYRFLQPVLDLVPESAQQYLVATRSVRREVPKVGRNEPCPCGSGQKFKKCCEDRPDRLQEVFASDLRDAERQRMIALTPRELGYLPLAALLRLPPADFNLAQRMMVLRRFAAVRWWPEALAAAEVARPDETDAQREQIRSELLEHLMGDAAARPYVEQLLTTPGLTHPSPWALELLRGSGDAAVVLQIVEDAVRRDDPCGLVDLADALLQHRPLLGIAIARAAIHPDRPLDNDMLVDAIQETRDELLLCEKEPTSDLLIALDVASHAALDAEDDLADDAEIWHLPHATARSGHPVAPRHTRLEPRPRESGATRPPWHSGATEGGASDSAAAAGTLRLELQAATQRAEALAAALREREDDLSARASARTGGEAEERDEREARLREMRRTVDTLKVSLRERNEERAELRRRVDLLESRPAAPPTAGESVVTTASEGDGIVEGPEDEPPSVHRLTVPVFEPRAADALQQLPTRVARTALRVVADLASGHGLAWRQAKPMHAVDGVWSARAGLHHRLLFRSDGVTLYVQDIVARQALDSTLRRGR